MNKRKTKEEMYRLVSAWEQGGQTRAAFCQSHGLSLGTFAYWRSKYQEEHASGSAAFLELGDQVSEQIEITYPNGVIVKLPVGGSLSDVRSLIGLS
ncbi:hypothetical protein FNH22_30785 [Fulvivirga sp. M361]|uniref:IS66 family insertion sequence element accessory protein TnpA n=1 Tax=Fulvivirga sp. M361 TaxID=2594266 RepID=UPI00117A56FC|nr:hypothetical protein [Fulvivirga sp. M361]TRX46439.1 hypothetical protein FNH22_30785 [Fulvivirga sp. M361]